MTLYYSDLSHYSRKVLIGLYEKKVDFRGHLLDLKESDQLQRWFLELSPQGQVPVLRHGDKVLADSTPILEYIDGNFGRPYQLFPSGAPGEKARDLLRRIDGINVFLVTYGVACFQTDGVTDVLRHPYYTDAFQVHMKNKMLSRPAELRVVAERNSDIEAGRIMAERAHRTEGALELFSDRRRFLKFLEDELDPVLDEVEEELADEDRLGPWLCGAAFTAPDVALTVLLVRLYQLGMDERLWKGGQRPALAVYQELAFRRPSVEKATSWRQHEGEQMSVSPRPPVVNGAGGGSGDGDAAALDAAKVGLGAVLAIGGIYACKKLFWKK